MTSRSQSVWGGARRIAQKPFPRTHPRALAIHGEGSCRGRVLLRDVIEPGRDHPVSLLVGIQRVSRAPSAPGDIQAFVFRHKGTERQMEGHTPVAAPWTQPRRMAKPEGPALRAEGDPRTGNGEWLSITAEAKAQGPASVTRGPRPLDRVCEPGYPRRISVLTWPPRGFDSCNVRLGGAHCCGHT